MKHSWPVFVILLLSIVTVPGCELIGDIFQAGVWVGVILVLAVIGIIGWIVAKSRS